MGNTNLYPEQISRERYLSDMDAVRQHLYDFSALSAQMYEMNESIKQEERDMENPDFLQKAWMLKWYALAVVVIWPIMVRIIEAVEAPDGTPPEWGYPFVVAGLLVRLALIIYIIYLWRHPANMYSKTVSFRKRLEVLEGRRNELNKIAVKKVAAETEIVSRLYYMPGKYLRDTTLYKLEEYIKHNGARTLAEAINFYEKRN